MAMVITVKCSYCHRDTRNPFNRDGHPDCTKQCFYDHMTHLSDANILRHIHKEGTANLSKKQRRHMIRLNLLKYSKNAKKFILTDNAQKILEHEILC